MKITSETTVEQIGDAACLGKIMFYELTQDELQALDWIGNRYDSAICLRHYILNGVLTLNTTAIDDLRDALASDGANCVPCLNEETTLARVVWAIGPATQP